MWIHRLIRKFRLKRIKPQVGDVYYGHVIDFVIGKNTEQFLYGMRDITGYERIWEPVPSDRAVRLTIDGDQNPNYRLVSEVLCTNTKNPSQMEWLKRKQFVRIEREQFKRMILDGLIKK
jgi:hypothetical protein